MKISVWFVAGVLACVSGLASGEPADGAEYAIRWLPGTGGPSLQETVDKLKIDKTNLERTTFTVQYFDIGKPPPASPGFNAIARERTEAGGKPELTFKHRGEAAYPKDKAWICPLDKGEQKKKDKYEVDVSVGTLTTTVTALVKAYSWSCETEIRPFPATLEASPKKCTSTMVRYSVEAGKVKTKVEEWTTSAGKLIEVSMSGKEVRDNDAGAKAFLKLIDPLRTAGIIITDRSKSEAGSDCQ